MWGWIYTRDLSMVYYRFYGWNDGTSEFKLFSFSIFFYCCFIHMFIKIMDTSSSERYYRQQQKTLKKCDLILLSAIVSSRTFIRFLVVVVFFIERDIWFSVISETKYRLYIHFHSFLLLSCLLLVWLLYFWISLRYDCIIVYYY